MFPETMDDYIAKDNSVRAYDAFVESLDLAQLKFELDPYKAGNPEYHPRAMLKLLIYGYAYGFRSSRKLERAVHHDLSFIWLMAGLKPDHKTIARFRSDNKKPLRNVLRQCVRMCLKLELVEGNTLFVDGSKFRADASINQTWTEERCEKALKKADARIDEILAESERLDKEERDRSSLVKLKEELKDKETLKAKIAAVQKEIKLREVESLNAIDPECVKVKGRQGTHAGYNAQIVVDEKHGLIVSSDVVSESNDINQFASQMSQAQENLGRQCEVSCGDAGYANTDELKKAVDQGQKVIVPSQKQAHDTPAKEFEKSQFQYDAGKDCYTCPQGNPLPYSHFDQDKQHRIYQMESPSLCRACPHFGVCTKDKSGRRIRRLVNEETKLKLEAQYKTPESQAVYKLRKQKVELPFGHIKRNLGAGAFLLRGLEGVNAEMSLLTSCFNIARMIGILGVGPLMAKLVG
jgi:transposase